MRVKIQYGVDVEEVPKKLLQLLESVGVPTSKVTKLWSEALSTLERDLTIARGTVLLESIDEMRQSLSKIDSILMDVSTIASGYVNLKKREEEAERVEEEMKAPPPPPNEVSDAD